MASGAAPALLQPRSSPLEGPAWIWSGQIPALNGLRAIAIACVFLSHFDRALPAAWSLGHFGVTAFFVISGFLITLLLLRERRKTQTVSLSGFYKRRVLRIVPAYTGFLTVMFGLQLAGFYHYSVLSWVAAVTYTTSLFMGRIDGYSLAHTWSLSVEEHFYLLWPLIFRFSRVQTATSILYAYVSLAPILRWMISRQYIRGIDLNYSSPTQMSSIATGCILAFVVTRQCAPRVGDFILRRPTHCFALGVGVFAISSALHIFPEIQVAASDPLKAAAFALCMAGLLNGRPFALARRFLDWGPVAWIGVLSYSLYLWQQPFTEHQDIPGGKWMQLSGTMAVAMLSYYLVERRFLRMKDTLTVGSRHTGSTVQGAGG